MAHQPKSKPLTIGVPLPGWTLSATDGKEYNYPTDKGTHGTVVAFSCNHCPYVKAYEERLMELARTYQPKGVKFFVINANDSAKYPDDSFEKMVDKSKTLRLPYTYVRDESQQAALDYGAGCTPEFFLSDAEGALVYTGRLDDNMEEPTKVQHHYLRDAIEAVIAGNTPVVQQSHAIGCSVKWKS